MDLELHDLCSRLRRHHFSEDIACRLFAALLPKLVASLRPAAAGELTVGAVSSSLQAISGAVSGSSPSMFSLSHVALRAQRMLAEEASRALQQASGAAAAAAAAVAAAAAAGSPAAALQSALQRELALEAQQRSAAGTALAALPADSAALPFSRQLEAALMDGLSELQDELENVGAGLLPFVRDCLRPGDVVVTGGGGCPTLSAFLARAASRSSAEEPLQVLWVQGGPPGWAATPAAAAAAALASASGSKARVTLVPEASAWAALGSGLAPAKCLLPAALLARDGSALVPAGGLALALEAAARGTPLLLLASAARLSPHPTAAAALRAATGAPTAALALLALQAPPVGVLGLQAAEQCGACGAGAVGAAGGSAGVTVLNALYDVLEAGLVSLVVTNAGVAAPAGVWRLCSEAYGGGGGGEQ